MPVPTVEELGEIFGFTADDLAANRAGRISNRQRRRMLLPDAALVAIVGIGSMGAVLGGVWFWSWVGSTDTPAADQLRDDWYALVIVVIAAVVLVVTIREGATLLGDVLSGKVRARTGSMRPTARAVQHVAADEDSLDLDVDQQQVDGLRKHAPQPFECTVYRTGGGGRLLSVDVQQQSEVSQ